MASRRTRRNGRKETGRFMMLPHRVLSAKAYIKLSPYGKQLIIDLFIQFNGKNNGDLHASWDYMKTRGWRSNDTLPKKIKEVLNSGLIVKTRQGGNKIPCLYAVTWLGIDECGGKLDVSSNPVPLNTWKEKNL